MTEVKPKLGGSIPPKINGSVAKKNVNKGRVHSSDANPSDDPRLENIKLKNEADEKEKETLRIANIYLEKEKALEAARKLVKENEPEEKIQIPCHNPECKHTFETLEDREKAEKVGCPICGVGGTKKLKGLLDKRRGN